MALAQRLELRQAQGLVMTPQLQQAIKLLQMSNLELQSFIEQELERNPLLEREEAETGVAEPAHVELPELPPQAAPLSLNEDAPPANAAEALDTEYDNLYADDSRADRAENAAQDSTLADWTRVKGSGGRFDDDDASSLEATLPECETLRGHLTRQIMHEFADAKRRLIASTLIDQIDEAGYFTGKIEESALQLGADAALVESVLKTIQRLDPTGAGARTLSECLTVQLEEKDRCDPAMRTLLGHLDLLARRDFAQLQKLCQVSAEDLSDMVTEIRALNPKPGLRFGSEPVQAAVPDVYVRDNGQGGFVIELNNDTLPRVLLNQRYMAQVSKRQDAKAYVAECMNTANWLIKSLDQRAKTILKVASEIVRQQDAFFVFGVTHLRPLNLRAIAEAIGMHESTVSRVTANKYIATPRGLFDMKYFFTASIASADGGEAHSAEAVRFQIRELIEREPENDILSDDKIVETLRKSGIEIARRTVAKYRESLRIPSSVERRKLKQSLALSAGPGHGFQARAAE